VEIVIAVCAVDRRGEADVARRKIMFYSLNV
jgi:hypothetical protein